MDGTLPSVVGGLVDCPVIAVPTSIGYGTAFRRRRPIADDAQLVRAGRDRRQHRQRFLGGVRRLQCRPPRARGAPRRRTAGVAVSRSLFLESVAGIAGDMFAAAFLDAGLVTREELERLPAELGLEGVRLDITHPIKATMRATHVLVTADDDAWKRALGASHDHAHGAAGVRVAVQWRGPGRVERLRRRTDRRQPRAPPDRARTCAFALALAQAGALAHALPRPRRVSRALAPRARRHAAGTRRLWRDRTGRSRGARDERRRNRLS